MTTILSYRRSLLDDRMAIYVGTFILGAVASVFVSYSAIFISKYHYNLTIVQYGFLFVPEFVAVVGASQFAAPFTCRCRAAQAYGIGLGCGLAGMALLIATEWAPRLPVSYPLLLVSSGLVGAGLGLSFPFVRCYAVSLKPLHSRRQILLVNSLLAAGLAASPIYALATLGTSAWWTLPALLAALLIAGILRRRSLRAPPDGVLTRADRSVPGKLRAYPGLALLYGVCAIVCIGGSQSFPVGPSPGHFPLLMLVEVGFWAALVIAGRVVFALIDGMESRQYAASLGVFMIAVVLLALSVYLTRYDLMHAGIYLLAVIGCAALLPIDTRPGNEFIAGYPLGVTIALIVFFPMLLGFSRLVYHRFALMGISPKEVFAGAAVLGGVACILLLPIILNWPTMAYFDRPAVRTAGPPGADMPGGGPSAPPPRRPSDHAEDASGGRGPGGATALPPRPQAGSRRDSGLPPVRRARPSVRRAPACRGCAQRARIVAGYRGKQNVSPVRARPDMNYLRMPACAAVSFALQWARYNETGIIASAKQGLNYPPEQNNARVVS
jgi:MFS family permease